MRLGKSQVNNLTGEIIEETLARNRKEVIDALIFWERAWTKRAKEIPLLMDYLGLEFKDIDAKRIIVKKKKKDRG